MWYDHAKQDHCQFLLWVVLQRTLLDTSILYLYGLLFIWVYQVVVFPGISYSIIFVKPFVYVSDIRFQKIHNSRKLFSTNIASGIICISGKICYNNAIKHAINMIKKMGPKINPCETPKSIFRKSLNSEPTLVFCFLL